MFPRHSCLFDMFFPHELPTFDPNQGHWQGGFPLLVGLKSHPNIAGWWFETFFIFHNIWDNPSHWLSYFSRWVKPPTRWFLTQSCFVELWTTVAFRFFGDGPAEKARAKRTGFIALESVGGNIYEENHRKNRRNIGSKPMVSSRCLSFNQSIHSHQVTAFDRPRSSLLKPRRKLEWG